LPWAVWLVAVVLFMWRIGSLEFFNPEPLCRGNYPKYFYLADVTARMVKDTGVFWGYDPTFAAGLLVNPGGATIAHNLPALVGALTGLSAAGMFKALLVAFFLGSPWLVYLGCRRFGLSVKSAAWIMSASVVLDFFSIRYVFVASSMAAYFSATPIFFFGLSLLAGGEKVFFKRLFWAFVFGVILWWWHVEQGVLWILALGVLVVLERKEALRPLGLAGLFAALFGIVFLCLPWLSPFLRFHWEALPFNRQVMEYIRLDWFGTKGAGYFLILVCQPIFLFFLAAWAFAWKKRARTPHGARSFLGVFCACLFLISLGLSLWTAASGFFAARFLDVFPVCLATFIALGMEGRPDRRRVKIWAGVFSLAAAAQVVLVVLLGWASPLFEKTPEDYRSLVRWIEANTSDEARIAFESSGDTGRQPLGFDPSSVLAMDTSRSYIALPSTESANLLYLGFLHDGRIGTNDLEELSRRRIEELFDLYNIGWVVASSPKTIRVLRRHHDLFSWREDISDFKIFSVNRRFSWFLAGSGKVEAALNRLSLSELEPDETGACVLAFHFFDSLEIRGVGRLERQKSPFDAIGFLRVLPGEKNLEIVNNPELGFRPFPEGFDFSP